MKALCAVGLSALAACGGTVDLPVVQDVDVFVSGGGVAAVSAACAAKAAGARVFLAAPRPQLGEDVCGKLRLRREPGDDERSAKSLVPSRWFGPRKKPWVRRSQLSTKKNTQGRCPVYFLVGVTGFEATILCQLCTYRTILLSKILILDMQFAQYIGRCPGDAEVS